MNDIPRRTTILYTAAWAVYALFSYTLFPVWDTTVMIPSILLVGLGAWLYRTRGGLRLTFFTLAYAAWLTSVFYSPAPQHYAAKLSGTVVLIAVSYLIGHLRNHYDAIMELNRKLDRRVAERTHLLSKLTEKLLSDSEKLKVSRGQELHDGMGQQLTGIQLLSSSLSEQLLDDNNSIASLAHHLRNQTSRAHQQIRRISRLLFPVRIRQVGLVPALNELAASIAEIKPITMQVVDEADLSPISEQISLQLYRICQEIALYAIDYLKAHLIEIRVSESMSDYQIQIAHDGFAERITERSTGNRGPFHLIEYRLKQIEGRMTASRAKRGNELTLIVVPKRTRALEN